MKKLPLWKVELAEGTRGPWKIEKFSISDDDARRFNVISAFNDSPVVGDRSVVAGTYTRLTNDGAVVMSDTPAEMRDYVEFISMARRYGGHVFMSGLGIGLGIENLINIPIVERITVVENNADVIKLVGEQYMVRDPRVRIIQCDAFDWKPAKRGVYSVVFHDIWPTISEENLPEMRRLSFMWRGKAKWIGYWNREGCRMQRRDSLRGRYRRTIPAWLFL